MDYIDPINRAIDHIEDNLAQPIKLDKVAAVAGYSRFYFDRLFLANLGETPARYIRKRRLSEAARELVISKKNILDIALDYQFQSQEAFTRSFKRMFRLSPAAYRKRRRLTKIFPKAKLTSRKIFYLNSKVGEIPKVIVPGQREGHILPARAYAMLIYRSPVNLQRHSFNAVHLFYC
ncbi:MAG: helix-turn-helix domain-containing protein [Anaerolineae bacterium]|nr:helix-turn-helix domain-containing protein [Anaerolineae bacterium]